MGFDSHTRKAGMVHGFRAQGLGFRILSFKVQGLGLRVGVVK